MQCAGWKALSNKKETPLSIYYHPETVACKL
jgi:hypothetical protein